MLLTSSPKTTLPQHSAGWAVLRVVKDRAYKYMTETPAHWGRHRRLNRDEVIKFMLHIRETRP